MTQQDIAEAKQLLFGIQETDLPAELKEASIKTACTRPKGSSALHWNP